MSEEYWTYRIYADGTVVHEDDFNEWDNSQPYYDDYGTYQVPIRIIADILGDDWNE